MQVDTTYEFVKERYPTQVAEVLARLAKGKSKVKNDPPETFKWEFSWCIQIGAYSAKDLASGNIPEKKKHDLFEEYLVGNIIPAMFLGLGGSKGRWWGYASTSISEPENQLPRDQFPEPIVEFYRKVYEKSQKPLMPVGEALKHLVGQPGFTAFRIEKGSP